MKKYFVTAMLLMVAWSNPGLSLSQYFHENPENRDDALYILAEEVMPEGDAPVDVMQSREVDGSMQNTLMQLDANGEMVAGRDDSDGIVLREAARVLFENIPEVNDNRFEPDSSGETVNHDEFDDGNEGNVHRSNRRRSRL